MINFPRRLRLGFKPWYGLTLRQLLYLLIAAMVAGGVVLTGSGEGLDLIIRVVIGLCVILVGVTLAFYRRGGLAAEQWLIHLVQFVRHPQLRFWNRGGGRSLHVPPAQLEEPPPAPRAPAGHVPAAAAVSAAPASLALSREADQAFVVLLDLVLLLSLLAFTVYLRRGGLAEIQSWVSMLVNR